LQRAGIDAMAAGARAPESGVGCVTLFRRLRRTPAGRRLLRVAAGSVSQADAPGRIRRNMPDPIPVIVLGRLAVHADWVGQGIGQGLLKDAVLRSLQACEQIGARALLCHAIDDAAKAFYAKHGFIKSPIHDMTLMLPLASRSSR